MENKSGHSREFKFENWGPLAAVSGRPTLGFGRPHLGSTGLDFPLKGRAPEGGPHASGFGFHLFGEEVKKCRNLLNL